MHQLLTPQEIESRAAQAGRTMTEVCRKAGVAPSTFTRWKAGQTEPTLGIYRRLVDAVSTPQAAA
jgi:predicted transcriptional regulator